MNEQTRKEWIFDENNFFGILSIILWMMLVVGVIFNEDMFIFSLGGVTSLSIYQTLRD